MLLQWGRRWLERLQKLQDYEVRRYWPKRYFASPESLLLWLLAFLLSLILAVDYQRWFAVLAVPIALWTIFDTILVNTSVAFVSRFPLNPLRSALLALLAFLNVLLSFAVINLAMPAATFDPQLHTVSSIYFSLVTGVTLGYGDFKAAGDLGRALVAIEILIGLYFLVVVLTIFVSWSSEPPGRRLLRRIDEVLN